MDAAKAMWVFYENPDCKELEDVIAPNEIKNLKLKARVACIPTSAGTGSEGTRASMIKSAKLKKKFSVRCMKGRMVPDVAILDPIFSVSMPRSLTAASGMDAITHAIESYVTPLANPFSDAMAMQGFKLGYENLLECYENPANLDARARMLASSYMAGVAFSNCALGIVHSIAHTFGAEYGVPHGMGNAIVLPYVLKFNSNSAEVQEKYDFLAYLVREKSLLEGIMFLRKRINIPERMKDIIKDEADVSAKLDLLTEKALSDVCTPYSPIKPTPDQMKDLLWRVYNGE
jgi:alcohol dehydrogenase class IV